MAKQPTKRRQRPAAADRRLVETPTLWDILPLPQTTDVGQSSTSLVAVPAPLMRESSSPVASFFEGDIPRTTSPDIAQEATFRKRILAEAHAGYIAVDGLYFRKGSQVHTRNVPDGEVIDHSFWRASRGGITWELSFEAQPVRDVLEQKAAQRGIPVEELSEQVLQMTVIDVAERLVGAYAGRVVHALYQCGNDCFRAPIFRLDLNAFLTLLGNKPDKHGHFRGEARAELRETLRALSHVILTCEERIQTRDGEKIIRQYERPLIRILATDFRELENPGGRRYWPSHVIVCLGWYSGVRQPDGSPGKDYIRHERLRMNMGNPAHHRTDEALRRWLLLLARIQLDATDRRGDATTDTVQITLTRGKALERAGITTKNVTQQKTYLNKALQKLQDQGLVVIYDAIPMQTNQTFSLVLRAQPIPLDITEDEEEEVERESAPLGEDPSSEFPVPDWPGGDLAPEDPDPQVPMILHEWSSWGKATMVYHEMLSKVSLSQVEIWNLTQFQTRWRFANEEDRAQEKPPVALVLLATGRGQASVCQRRYLWQLEQAAHSLAHGFPPLEVVVRPIVESSTIATSQATQGE